LPAWAATFFEALGAAFFTGFAGLALAFAGFGREAFFAGFLDFAGAFEFFFFAELAIFWEAPLVCRARAEAY
jgi:hypothetical protein